MPASSSDPSPSKSTFAPPAVVVVIGPPTVCAADGGGGEKKRVCRDERGDERGLPVLVLMAVVGSEREAGKNG
jgi:hypothetical protein